MWMWPLSSSKNILITLCTAPCQPSHCGTIPANSTMLTVSIDPMALRRIDTQPHLSLTSLNDVTRQSPNFQVHKDDTSLPYNKERSISLSPVVKACV
jgi:hypothetical protein